MRKPRLLVQHVLRDLFRGLFQLRIRILHQIAHRKNHFVQKRLRLSQQPPVRNRAPNNFSQHIAAAFVRGQHSIGNQKRRRAGVVGDHSERSRGFRFRFFLQFLRHRCSRQLCRPLDQRRKQIRLVIRNHALQHRRHPLQPHAGINRWLGQRIQLPAGIAVKLHEHQIPNLDIAAAVAREVAIRMSLLRRRRAHVVVNFAARTAGAGVAHLPEVVFQPHLKDAVLRHALRSPQVIGFGVALQAAFAVKDRHVQLVFRNPIPLRRSNQLPRIGNRIFLEIIAERKIPQHLKKRVMPIGESDIFQIVVLAAGAHALLRSGGARVVALLQPQKNVFKLVHPRVGEQQRGIVRRDQRRRMHLLVPLLHKEVEKLAADFGASRHSLE